MQTDWYCPGGCVQLARGGQLWERCSWGWLFSFLATERACMAEAPQDVTPTYTVTDQGGVTHYTCLIQDASMPGGVCSHDATDFELFKSHMDIRHAGVMVAAPSPGDPAP